MHLRWRKNFERRFLALPPRASTALLKHVQKRCESGKQSTQHTSAGEKRKKKIETRASQRQEQLV
jgi:hypothetical protein